MLTADEEREFKLFQINGTQQAGYVIRPVKWERSELLTEWTVDWNEIWSAVSQPLFDNVHQVWQRDDIGTYLDTSPFIINNS